MWPGRCCICSEALHDGTYRRAPRELSSGVILNPTTPSSLYCLLSLLGLSLSIQNGIVKCIYDGSLDNYSFPAFLFHEMFSGCVRKVGLFPGHSEGCLHETLPSLLFPCPFTRITALFSCLLHEKLHHIIWQDIKVIFVLGWFF